MDIVVFKKSIKFRKYVLCIEEHLRVEKRPNTNTKLSYHSATNIDFCKIIRNKIIKK